MSNKEANSSFPDQKQRAAFCYSQWKRHKKAKAEEWIRGRLDLPKKEK